MRYIFVTISLLGSLFLIGCGVGLAAQAEPTPAAQQNIASIPSEQFTLTNTTNKKRFSSNCVYPAAWHAYTIQDDENSAMIAARHGLSAQQLLDSNCLQSDDDFYVGRTIYIPIREMQPRQNILPLSVTFFSSDVSLANPMDIITLTWQGQGNVQSVRLGRLISDQFYEIATNLPNNGSLEVAVPNDGTDMVTYLVLVSDGYKEVAARTDVQLTCDEVWFFSPTPSGCPTAPLLTGFYQQIFERGSIIYIPTLDQYYIFVVGQEVVTLDGDDRPTSTNADFTIPSTFYMTENILYQVWASDDIRNALGYAVTEGIRYDGLLQRSTQASGNLTYLLASSGHIYRFGEGVVWGVIIPQSG